MMSLENAVAIVTGASSGIGRGIAKGIAEDGANVVVADIQREPVQGERYMTDVTEPTDKLVQREYDVKATFIKTDVRDSDAVESLVETTVDTYGGLDILVNNAGIHRPGDSQTTTESDWDDTIDVNLKGCFLTSKFAVPSLKASEQGRIINISSVNAIIGGSGPGYASSKAGIVNLTRDLAQELASDGVTANAVLPGVIKTPIQDENDDKLMRAEIEQTPLPRIGEPADVANAVRFFASERAEWITGASLLVDGGFMTSF